MSHSVPSVFKVTAYWDDGASLASAATGSWTPKLCISTMDKDDIMKKTKRKT